MLLRGQDPAVLCHGACRDKEEVFILADGHKASLLFSGSFIEVVGLASDHRLSFGHRSICFKIILLVKPSEADLTFLVQFGVQLWMYATPVIYPLSNLSTGRAAQYLWLMKLNPLTSILETFKLAFLGTGTFSWGYFSYSFASTIIVMALGMLVFNKVQRSFMDVI